TGRRRARRHRASRRHRRNRSRRHAAGAGRGHPRPSRRGGNAMMEVTLHPTPRWRDVVLEQIRIVGLSLRTGALVAAVVLAVVTLIVGRELARGGPGFDSQQPFPTALVSFLLPFAVWRTERSFGPAFLWTLPADRR